MESAKTPEFKKIIQKFNRRGVKYILIGRQAVVLYGAPLTSFDYDLWISSDYRKIIFDILEQLGFESSYDVEEKKPLITFIKEIFKIDVFFVKSFGKSISFEECFENSQIFKDEKTNFFIRVASIDDIIKLKKFRGTFRLKDIEDIEYLKKLRIQD